MEKGLRKIIIQITLWVAYFALIYALYSARLSTGNAVIVAGIIGFLHLFLFYMNYSVLMPKLYFEEKRVIYFLLITLALVVVVWLGKYSLDTFFHMEITNSVKFGHGQMRRPPKDVPFVFFRFFPILFPALIVTLVSSVLKSAEQISLKNRQMIVLRQENVSAELKMLRSQINPHFLFNALNNIYSMSIESSQRTPDVILKFSQMLRYMIYDSNVEKMPLNKEIENIKNYIDIQKLKDESMTNIEFAHNESRAMISPMLLLPFVENAFKHSRIEDTENGWIKVTLKTLELGQLEFVVENSVPPAGMQKDAIGGIGIENVRKRLELLYPEKHTLYIEQSDKAFKVNLQLQLGE